jgi:hypothetical protein
VLAAIKILNVPKSIYDLMREAGWFEYSDPTSLAPVTIGNPLAVANDRPPSLNEQFKLKNIQFWKSD